MLKTIYRKLRKKFFATKGDRDVGEVLKGGMVSFLYRILTMLVSYGVLYFISKYLGSSGVGVFNISIDTASILVMVGCLGFNTSIVRFVSQYSAKSWHGLIRLLYRSIFRISMLLSIALGVGLYFASEWIALDYYDDPELIIPLKVSAISIPFLVMSTINVEFIRGLKKVQISELFRNLSIQFVTLVGIVISSFVAVTSAGPVKFYALGAAIAFLATSYFIHRYLKQQAKNTKEEDITDEPPAYSFRFHLGISIPMILTSFIQLLNGKVDVLMLGYFRDTSDVGVFAMAFKLSVITNFVIGALKTIAMPKISELFWSDKRTELNNVIQYSTRLIFIFSFPVSVILLVFPEFILGIFKEEFIVGATTLRIFAVTQLINACSGMVAVFLNMAGHQGFFTRLVTITTAMNIGLNLLLIPKWGLEGAAIATMVSTVSWNLIGVYYIYKKNGIMTFYNPFYKIKPAANDGANRSDRDQ